MQGIGGFRHETLRFSVVAWLGSRGVRFDAARDRKLLPTKRDARPAACEKRGLLCERRRLRKHQARLEHDELHSRHERPPSHKNS